MRFFVYGYRGMEEYFGTIINGHELAAFAAEKRGAGWTVQWRALELRHEALA